MELIIKEDVMNIIRRSNDCYGANERVHDITEKIIALPAIGERKTGRWIPVTNGRGGSECNQCHSYAPSYQSGVENKSNYCPHCGAKMEGAKEV